MTLHLGPIDSLAPDDPRDRRLALLFAMLAESQEQNGVLLRRIKALDERIAQILDPCATRVDLLVQVELLTSDLVETQRQLRLARGKPV